MMKHLLHVLAITASAALLACWPGGCSRQPDADDAYSGGYDESALITITAANGYADIVFPANQLIVMLADGFTRDDMLALAEEMDIRIVGQIPSLQCYQVELTAQDAEELAAAAARLRARAEIKSAGFNLIRRGFGADDTSGTRIVSSPRSDNFDTIPRATATEIGSCPASPDVSLLSDESLLPYHFTGYLSALEIMIWLNAYLTPGPIQIALLLPDGYNYRNSELRHMTDFTFNASERGGNGNTLSMLSDDDHGSALAGIIFAENNGTGINGLATTLVGEDNTPITVARPANDSEFSVLVAVQALAEQGHIVMLPARYGPFRMMDISGGPAYAAELQAGAVTYSSIMQMYPEVLFVAAAPPVHMELTDGDAEFDPHGLENLIVVTAWSAADMKTKASQAAYGEFVDIAAPGDAVAVADHNGTVVLRSSTDYAAAFVTSAAAMLWSVGGNTCGPSDIKAFLQGCTWNDSLTQPGNAAQLYMSDALACLLWEKYGDQPWASALNWDSDGDYDPPEQIEIHLCYARYEITVEGFGSYSMDPEGDICHTDYPVMLDNSGTRWTLGITGRDAGGMNYLDLMMTAPSTQPFALEYAYPVSDDYVQLSAYIVADTNGDCRYGQNEEKVFSGRGISGTVSFTSCSIVDLQETGGELLPSILSVDIEIDAVLRGATPDQDTVTARITGKMQGVEVYAMNPLLPFTNDVETSCIGTGSFGSRGN